MQTLDEKARRNAAIADALRRRPVADVMREYGLSRSQVYRIGKSHAMRSAIGKGQAERFAAETPGKDGSMPTPSGAVVNLYSELGRSGLRRYGGTVDDDYDRAFRTLRARIALYREMGDDPIVAAVLQAIKMTLRRVSWYAEPDGDTDADKKAAEWLDTCMHDMSHNWTDVVDQALGMLQYGFYPAEIVYKPRRGDKTQTITADVNGKPVEIDLPTSKYDDGRIGWRKFCFLAPETLAPGSEWDFDDYGGLRGLNQQPPPDYPTIYIPIEKIVNFRTTAERGNPEGRALLRPMWWSWYLKHNLEELEAIAAERYGAGFPVVYLGDDTTRNPEDPNSDLVTFKDIVRNIRVDEMAGATIPYAKMGAGAAEGRGALLEFVSPPGKGPVDFGQAIVRHEQRMTMVGLAQFIHLGMSETGSRALGQSATDFFTLAVSAWADALADTFQRYAVDRLFRLNSFPGLTAVPKIAHEAVAQTDIGMVAEYINKLVGAQLLTPTEELERYLLELADLPVSQKIAEIWEEKEKARKAGLDAAKNLAQQGPAVAQGQQGPAVAQNGAPPDKDSGETGEEADEASALLGDVEIDDVKANVFLAKFSAIADRFNAGQGAPESDLARELRRSNDLLEQSMRFGAQPAAAMPTIKFEHGNVELPEGFGAQAAPVVNVDMAPVAQALERFAEMAMPALPAPNVTVTNTVDTGPIADALRQTPAPVVNVSVPPQAAPVVNVPPARVTAEVVMPDVTETAKIERDGNGLMTGVTKTRKARKG